MPITIGTNVSSLRAQRALDRSAQSLASIFERLSSGQRINKASDDAAGLAIAESLNVRRRVYNQAVRNVNDGISALTVAEGALAELTGICLRQRELATQAANGVYSVSQRRALNDEANALVDEFNRITAATEFNGLRLLDGSLTQLQIQAGYGTDGGLSVDISSGLARTVGDGTFSGSEVLTTGLGLVNAIAEDVNGDGIADIVSDDRSNSSLSVFIGNGNGTFAVRSQVSTVAGPRFTSGDLDGDGIADLAVVGGATGFGNILLGNGNGTFRTTATFASSTVSRGIVSGDLDGDGAADLVVADYSFKSISILWGNGDGTFQQRVSYVYGSGNIYDLTIADFNADGKPDIAGAAFGGGVNIYTNNGGRNFSPGGFAVNSSLRLASGDFNSDGLDDVAVNASYLLKIYLSNGDGTFSLDDTRVTPSVIYKVSSGDLNGDGRDDIVTGGNTGELYLFTGNGDGTFTTTFSATVGTGRLYGMAISDFNSDGAVDLGAPRYGDDEIALYLANPAVTTAAPYLNLNTPSRARQALVTIDETLDRLSAQAGTLGAMRSRLAVAAGTLAVASENSAAAAGRITDADIAQESAALVRTEILQQAGAGVLAQANQQPGLALMLLGR